MAIDTAEDRKSISGILLLIPGVTPNALQDAEWRQQAGWSYSGIAIGVAGITRRRHYYYPFIAERVIFRDKPRIARINLR